MLSNTKGVISKCLESIKQGKKIKIDKVKNYVNFYLNFTCASFHFESIYYF